jgi:hypothetical protein
MRLALLFASSLLGLVGLSGCRCGRDAAVPFHRGGEPGGRGEPTSAGLAPLEAAEHPEGTRGLPLEGTSLRIEDGSVRASAVFDFDRDGDRDVLFVVLGATSAAVRVMYAEQQPSGLATPISLASRATLAVEGGEGTTACAPTRASILPLSESIVLVSVDARCDDFARPRLSVSWALTADARPRSLETLDFLGRDEGEGLSFAAEDRDHDGHDDLAVEVRIATSAGPVTTTLTWMSRAAGLAREGEQPEPTIAALGTQAREAVRRDPARAIAAADKAIALREALCREAEQPRLWVGGTRGVACGASASSGRAYAMRAAALARRLPAGPPTDRALLGAALDAFLALDRQGVSIREGDRALVRESWMRVASVPPTSMVVHRGPPVSPVVSRPGPRLSTLAFVREDRVLVRGAEPRFVTLTGAEARVEPAPASEGDWRLRSPGDGPDAPGLELVAIERRCEGTVLVIAPSGGVGGSGGERHEVLASPRPPPAAARCPTMPEGHRLDDGGFVALGWAPQGVILARGVALSVVPIDARGEAAGPAEVLPARVPAPAPIAPGAALSDVAAYALALPFGIVVVDRRRDETRIYRDDDFAVPQGASFDVALAPSGRRAAWICGGALCWADLASSGSEPTARGGRSALPPTPPPELARAQHPEPDAPPVPTPAPE